MTHVRLLTGPGDAALWQRLALEAISENPEAFMTTREAEAALPLSWFENALAEGTHVFVAGADLGLTVVRTEGMMAKLSSVYVRSCARGQGIGDALIEGALSAARASGCTQCRLWVFSDNGAAIALYRRHGFALWSKTAYGERWDWTMRCQL